MDEEISSLVAQIESLGKGYSPKDADKRVKLRAAVSKLSLALEEPRDVLEGLSMQVSSSAILDPKLYPY